MLHVILTADPFLGKFDQLSLSDQASMELLVQCFDEKTQKRYKDQDGHFIDISKWEIVNCNDEGIVTYLELPGPEYESDGYYTDDDFYYDSEDDFPEDASLAGSLETKYIPRQLATLEIQQCSLTGTFDVSALPATVKSLIIEDVERMHGTFDFGNLPECSKCVHIINSGFSGTVDLTCLPQSLTSLHISRTRFSGEVDLTKLPPKLEKLNPGMPRPRRPRSNVRETGGRRAPAGRDGKVYRWSFNFCKQFMMSTSVNFPNERYWLLFWDSPLNFYEKM